MLWQILLLEFLLLSSDIDGASASAVKPACLRFRTCQYPYVVVFDAGSTGTTAIVYQFSRTSSSNGASINCLSEKRSRRSKPGITAFNKSPSRIKEYLTPLLEFARNNVPQASQAQTIIFLAATAGVRALTRDEQRATMRMASSVFRRSPFSFAQSAEQLGLAVSFVLSGVEEAYYALLATNLILHGRNTNPVTQKAIFGILEMGGGSTQIAVGRPTELSSIESWGQLNKTSVFASSTMGLGKSAATLGILGYRKNEHMKTVYKSPCLNPRFAGKFSFNSPSINVTGDPLTQDSSRWSDCQAKVREYISSVGPISQPPHIPIGNYLAVGVFFYNAASLKRFGDLRSRNPIVLLSELEEAGKKACVNPPLTGRYDPFLCMDSVFIATLLKEGFALRDGQILEMRNSFKGLTFGWPLGIAAAFAKRATNNFT